MLKNKQVSCLKFEPFESYVIASNWAIKKPIELAIVLIVLGSTVGRLRATDDDGGVEGKIIYVMAGWSENQGFKINPNNGKHRRNNCFFLHQ